MQDKKFSRRSFLKMVGGIGAASLSLGAAGCASKPSGGDGWMPTQYNRAGNWPVQVKGRVPVDANSVSLARDDAKCILCGQCLEVCQKVMSVHGYYELPIKDDTICINCGQCTMWCPTGSLHEKRDIDRVIEALEDDSLYVVVQTAPATKVALGEEFGMAPGTLVDGKQVSALRALGFDSVLDTCFMADLTIMEEAAELVKRVKEGVRPPMFTSCCPGWVKFCEYYYADLIPTLSSCKSPMQMGAALIKSYYAQMKGLDPTKIFSVAIMPCTAKKFEAIRPEFAETVEDMPDTDAVLTTRELALLLKAKGINFDTLDAQGRYDSLMGESTGAGAIFGATGGVMEAAIRTGYYYLTGSNPPEALLDWQPVRGLKGVKEAVAAVPGVGNIRVAVCHGTRSARKILDEVRAGNVRWDFIEVMACPGGCVAGGGQPRTALPPNDEIRKVRADGLYHFDAKIAKKRLCHENSEIQDLYRTYLGEPMSEKAHHLLHTHYQDRSSHLTPKKADSALWGDRR